MYPKASSVTGENSKMQRRHEKLTLTLTGAWTPLNKTERLKTNHSRRCLQIKLLNHAIVLLSFSAILIAGYVKLSAGTTAKFQRWCGSYNPMQSWIKRDIMLDRYRPIHVRITANFKISWKRIVTSTWRKFLPVKAQSLPIRGRKRLFI